MYARLSASTENVDLIIYQIVNIIYLYVEMSAYMATIIDIAILSA
jgi:hypothetical protein